MSSQGQSQFPAALNVKEEDVQKMLATSVHVGSRNLEPGMARYVYKRTNAGTYLINLEKTWEKLVLAARVIVAIENPADVCVISGRPYGQRATLKFAKYTGATSFSGRYTPGTFTNQMTDKFQEPRLLVVTDPRTDHQAIREGAYSNIPVIAFCHTDSPLTNVDIAIPCNNKGKTSIGLMWWLLCREVLYLRNAIPRGQPWNEVMVDMFFYRDPEEQEKQEAAEAEAHRGGEGEGEARDANWNQDQEWGATGEWGSSDPIASKPGASQPQNWDARPAATAGWEAPAQQ